MARPSEFKQAVADAICKRLCEGESLRSVCRDAEMPSVSTVIRWASQRPEFGQQYRLACEAREAHLFDEMREIADDGSRDWFDKSDGKGGTVRAVDHENINRSRLRVDTIKWQLAKLNPGKYGDRQQIDSTVEASVKVEREPVSDLDAARGIAFMLAKHGMEILPPGMKAVPIDAVILSRREDDTPRQLAPAQLERMGLLPAPDPSINKGFTNGSVR